MNHMHMFCMLYNLSGEKILLYAFLLGNMIKILQQTSFKLSLQSIEYNRVFIFYTYT